MREFYNSKFLPAAEETARAVAGGTITQLPPVEAPPSHPLQIRHQRLVAAAGGSKGPQASSPAADQVGPPAETAQQAQQQQQQLQQEFIASAPLVSHPPPPLIQVAADDAPPDDLMEFEQTGAAGADIGQGTAAAWGGDAVDDAGGAHGSKQQHHQASHDHQAAAVSSVPLQQHNQQHPPAFTDQPVAPRASVRLKSRSGGKGGSNKGSKYSKAGLQQKQVLAAGDGSWRVPAAGLPAAPPMVFAAGNASDKENRVLSHGEPEQQQEHGLGGGSSAGVVRRMLGFLGGSRGEGLRQRRPLQPPLQQQAGGAGRRGRPATSGMR